MVENFQILFVDDDPHLLAGIRRAMRATQPSWVSRCAENGQTALRMLDEAAADVVVSDLQMPGMDGSSLLARVRQQFPASVRILLTGSSEQAMVVRESTHVHQILAKPCPQEELHQRLDCLYRQKQALPDLQLRANLHELVCLPALPEWLQELEIELQSPEPSMHLVSNLIALDPGLSGKVLQIVNSTQFSPSRSIENIGLAVRMIGLEAITGLVMALKVFEQVPVAPHLRAFQQELWRHCQTTAILSRNIARLDTHSPEELSGIYSSGLLHDCGRLLLALLKEDTGLDGTEGMDEELRRFGVNHAAMGAYLLSLWGMPKRVIQAALYHHTPWACPTYRSQVETIYLANMLDRATQSEIIRNLDEAAMPDLERRVLKDRLSTYLQTLEA